MYTVNLNNTNNLPLVTKITEITLKVSFLLEVMGSCVN